MFIGGAPSINGVAIRLTEERWLHITSSHPEIEIGDFYFIFETIEDPEVVFRGDADELLAVKKRPRKDQWLVVVYKETIRKKDGFVITAYITTDFRWLLKRKIIWNKK